MVDGYKIGCIFQDKLGARNWKDLLAPFLEGVYLHGYLKSAGIAEAIKRNPDKLEDIMFTLLRAHGLSKEEKQKLNELLSPAGLMINQIGMLKVIYPTINQSMYLERLSNAFRKKIQNVIDHDSYIQEFDFHKANVADSYEKNDWKKLNSELRNLLETIIKALSNLPQRNSGFNMKEALDNVFGKKSAETDLIYGIYRLLSNQGSHSGIPDEILAKAGYKMLRDISEIVFGINLEV